MHNNDVAYRAAGRACWRVPQSDLPTRLTSGLRSAAIHPASACTQATVRDCLLQRYYCCVPNIPPADYKPSYQLIVGTAVHRWEAPPTQLGRVFGWRQNSPCRNSSLRKDLPRSPGDVGCGRTWRGQASWPPWSSFPRPPAGEPDSKGLCSVTGKGRWKEWMMAECTFTLIASCDTSTQLTFRCVTPKLSCRVSPATGWCTAATLFTSAGDTGRHWPQDPTCHCSLSRRERGRMDQHTLDASWTKHSQLLRNPRIIRDLEERRITF